MSDLISRQAAIECLEMFLDKQCDRERTKARGFSDNDIWAAVNMAYDALSDEKVMKWTPVSERLPEIGEHYVSEPCIVYCSNGAYGFAELEENIFGQVGWNCERDDEYHEPLGEVLAWMPLPEPWKGEENEADT